MEMVIADRGDGISLVHLKGRLDVNGMRSIDTAFYSATAAKNQPAVVEMGEVEFISSLGIGMLFGCARSLGRNGHRMIIASASGFVAETMKMVGVHELIPFTASVEEAMALLQESK